MTPKQQRFVEEYLVDLNATAAYRRAGYAAKGNAAEVNAARLLRNAQVQAAISAAQTKRSEETRIDAAYVLRQAVKLHERCMQEISPVTDRKGQQVHDEHGSPLFEFNAMGASKALELVGKHVGVQAFKEQIDHRHSFAEMTDEELDAAIARRLGQA